MSSTIENALQKGDEDWEIIADEDGDIMEVKSWGEIRAYTVYHKFKPGDTILVKGSSSFREPNRGFSMSKCDIYSRWWIDPFDHFNSHSYMDCIFDIDYFRRSKKQPANVLGIFHSFVEGNHTYRRDSGGRVLTQGYYVRFTDVSGHLCQALVWHNLKVERGKFVLFHAKPGISVLLLPYAREQEEQYRNRTPGIYMITTTYPPVIDPPCLDPAVVKKLRHCRQALQIGEEMPYNPSANMNGTH